MPIAYWTCPEAVCKGCKSQGIDIDAQDEAYAFCEEEEIGALPKDLQQSFMIGIAAAKACPRKEEST